MSLDDARDDLAFLRNLVAPGDNSLRTFGQTYAAGGACYGAQMLMHGAQMLGLLSSTGPVALAVSFGPTVVFAALMTWILTRPGARSGAVGVHRAVRHVFQAIGTAGLALMLVIASVALRLHSLTIWLIYPCVVMVLQGVGWMVAASLWRRTWMVLVALGWFACGIAAGLSILTMPVYVLIIGAAMIGLMLAPGVAMIRMRTVA